MTDATPITFEQGYRRLQEIAERVSSDEVPVHEMCELFAEGKGLERALSAFLAEQRSRVESIDRGEEIRAFRIVPPGGGRDEPRPGDDLPF